MNGDTTSGRAYLQRPPQNTPPLYAQDGRGYGATVYAHYFLADNDWLVTEYDPGEDVAFGWACLGGDRLNAELGYLSLPELEQVATPVRVHDPATGRTVTLPDAQRVDYDANWEPCPLAEAVEALDERMGR